MAGGPFWLIMDRNIVQIIVLEKAEAESGRFALAMASLNEMETLAANAARLPCGKISTAPQPVAMKHHLGGDVVAIERGRDLQSRALGRERGGHDFIGIEVEDPGRVKINRRMRMITLRGKIDKGMGENPSPGGAGEGHGAISGA